MKDAMQVVLVAPNSETCEMILGLLSRVDALRIAEVSTTYQGAPQRVSEIAPNLVVVEMDSDPSQAISVVQMIVEANPEIAVLPASRVCDSSVILRVLRAGAREFLPLPAGIDELRDTIKRLVTRLDESLNGDGNKTSQIIAVTGASGGIGCTTMAINLGTTLARTMSHEVVLADFDLMLGSVDTCLDIIPDQTLQGIVQNVDRLDLTLLKRSITRHCSGLFVLPHPTAMEESAKIDPEALRRVLVLLGAAYPTVVIDTSKGLQSSDFVAFEMADIILIALQLDLTCLRNTSRLLHLFEQFEGFTQKVRLVLNRSGSFEGEISLKKAEETLKMPVSWHLPNATKIVQSARSKGVPIEAVAEGSKMHLAILEMAKGLRPQPAVEKVKPRRGLFAAFF
ncbi:MAG: AAA family ATPase [Isosphaeraceae bacterium]